MGLKSCMVVKQEAAKDATEELGRLSGFFYAIGQITWASYKRIKLLVSSATCFISVWNTD